MCYINLHFTYLLECAVLSYSHAGFGPLCVALADRALTLMETIMADLKLESLSPTAVSACSFLEWKSL